MNRLAETGEFRWTVLSIRSRSARRPRVACSEAFSNLLDNANQVRADNGEVRIELADHPQGAQLTISDNRAGDPEREREAVLQPLLQRRSDAPFAGSGLGLSIVSAVMRLHDFALRVGANGAGTNSGTSI